MSGFSSKEGQGKGGDLLADPETLRLVRERRGYTKGKVAELLGKSAPWLTKVEAGDTPVTGDNLAAYAAVLEVPQELLATSIPAEPPEGAHFRSQQVPQKVRRQAVAAANLAAYVINTTLQLAESDNQLALPEWDADTLKGGAAEAAELLRFRLRMQGPIADMAAVLEQFGIFVLPMPPEITKIDAVTVRTDGPALAVILLAERVPEDRKRHTLAHELGHLVLDLKTEAASLKDVEARADLFAGEFLAPYDEVQDDLAGITPAHLATLVSLHRTWGVSPSALIRRAYIHDDISESQYRYWFRVLAARNLLRGAPSSFSVQPAAARELLGAIKDAGYSVADILSMTHFRVGDLAETLGEAWPYQRPRPRLHEVDAETIPSNVRPLRRRSGG